MRRRWRAWTPVALAFVAGLVVGASAFAGPLSPSSDPVGTDSRPTMPEPDHWGPKSGTALRRVTSEQVPPGTKLQASGDLKVVADHAVVDGWELDGCLVVGADAVTIRNSRVRCSGWSVLRVLPGFRGTLVEAVEIDGSGSPRTDGIVGSDLVVRRSDIHGVGDGVKVGSNSLYERNRIRDLASGDGKHVDGFQMTQGHNAVVRHNRIDAASHNSAIILKADHGPITDVLVDGNLLDGGNYTVYSRTGNSGHTPEGVRLVDNRFGRSHQYGLLSVDGSVTGHGNVWADTGAPIEDAVLGAPG